MLSTLMVVMILGICSAQDDYQPAPQSFGPPTSFNFNDGGAVEAPKPPFLNLPAVDNPQPLPSNFQLVTKVFRLPDGGITTLQVPEQINN